MFCKNCGREIGKDENFCPGCGAKLEYWNVSEDSPNTVRREGSSDYEEPNATLWIVIGVLSSIFCCLIGGIGTTVYAAKASGNISAGDFEQAKENIETSKKWFIATVIVGVITFFIGMIAGV
ncbi:MAG: CD225/dispanin family protein [Oscillospiraceae bacterium]|nr:CD225/dispanin family protein [Oscillospiraceae bacterium]